MRDQLHVRQVVGAGCELEGALEAAAGDTRQNFAGDTHEGGSGQVAEQRQPLTTRRDEHAACGNA
jgi:hypothetical protein